MPESPPEPSPEASSEAPELPEIACENCVAACCKAPMLMMMSEKEYSKNSPPMDLKVIRNPSKFAQRVSLDADISAAPVRVPARTGFYLLMSGCANLDEDDRCSIYVKRPTCCAEFEVGSPACRRQRRKAGLDADRPITDEENDFTSPIPEPSPDLVQQFFPDYVDEANGENAGVPTTARAEIGLDLPRLRAAVAREARWISEQLSACEKPRWSRHTRCAEWDIGALAAHLVTGLRTADAVLRAAIDGHSATTPDDFEGDRVATIRAFGPDADAVCALFDRVTPELVPREVILDEDEAVTVHDLIEALVVELAVHGLDLANALGETRHLAPEAIGTIAHALPNILDPGTTPPAGTAYVLRSAAFEVPLTWTRNAWRSQTGANPCVIEGDPEAVLLYALGRVPFNKSNLETNRPDLARVFKRHLVGP